MRKALQEAEAAMAEGEIPIGAVIVCQDHVIARAHNLTETLHDVTAHAEMQAITQAANELGGKYLTDCTLYVTVEPCVMCAGALGWSQIPAWCMVVATKNAAIPPSLPMPCIPNAASLLAFWKTSVAN